MENETPLIEPLLRWAEQIEPLLASPPYKSSYKSEFISSLTSAENVS